MDRLPYVRLEQWLLVRRREVLASLITVNLLVGTWLLYDRGPSDDPAEAVVEPLNAPKLVIPHFARNPEVAEPFTDDGTDNAQRKVCRIWGPEDDADSFTALLNRLKADGGLPEVVASEIQAEPDYLVAVVGFKAVEQAKRSARELGALKIESYLLQREGYPPALSVGVFSRKKLAQAQQDRIAALGYEVRIDPLARRQTVYNLWAHVSADSDVYATSVAPCPAIAQTY